MRTFTDDELTRFIAKVREEAKAEIREDFVLTRANIRKIKAEAWDEGYEAGRSSPYGTATPSGKSYDPEPNPYRIEGQA